MSNVIGCLVSTLQRADGMSEPRNTRNTRKRNAAVRLLASDRQVLCAAAPMRQTLDFGPWTFHSCRIRYTATNPAFIGFFADFGRYMSATHPLQKCNNG